MSKISKSSINWAQMEKLVPKEQRGNFLAFKAKSENYARKMMSYPEKAPEIDWEYYRKFVPDPSMVDKFKDQYSKVSIPYPSEAPLQQVDQEWASLEPEIKAYVAEADKDIQKLQKEIDRMQALPKFDEMTMETFYLMNPESRLDFVNNPTFWPHTPEEQPGYITPEEQAEIAAGGGDHH